MELHTYIKENPGSGVKISTLLGVSPSYFSQMCTGHRPISPATCVAIEQATKGAVSRQDLRPDDWRSIWPELSPAPRAKTRRSA